MKIKDRQKEKVNKENGSEKETKVDEIKIHGEGKEEGRETSMKVKVKDTDPIPIKEKKQKKAAEIQAAQEAYPSEKAKYADAMFAEPELKDTDFIRVRVLGGVEQARTYAQKERGLDPGNITAVLFEKSDGPYKIYRVHHRKRE